MKIIENIKLKVDETHTLNILECGNKNGVPVIFLHGGPGGSVGEKSLEFFNENHHVILFDQRGTGKSTPFLETKNVTPFHTIEDMEKIRKHFGIEKWTVFGGSYGSTLALLYAILHPERVENLVLRGIFLGREEDVHWLYEEGASYYFPELFEEYKNFLPENKRNKIVDSYYEIFMSDDEEKKKTAAIKWANWEDGLVTLLPGEVDNEYTDQKMSLAFYECFYFKNKNFFPTDNYILKNADKIKNIKTYIVHGRYDIDCRPIGAYCLAQKLENVELYITDAAGHSPYEENNLKKLREIMNGIK